MKFSSLLIASFVTLFSFNVAFAKKCSQWKTECSTPCVEWDQYGQCSRFEQHCTQTCVAWVDEKSIAADISDEDDSFELQLNQAAKLYPVNAKQMLWHIDDKNNKIIIDHITYK